MKYLKNSLIQHGTSFALGVSITLLSFWLMDQKANLRREEQSWFVCARVNMSILADVLRNYAQTNRAEEPINIETLVRAGALPPLSEIFVCPSFFRIAPLRTNYGPSFNADMTNSIIAAHYSNCSYYVETLPDAYRIRCKYHSNVLDYAVSTRSESSR